MASDSDLEAYLNQLSKKTHKLQQDVQTDGYSSSRLPSEEDKSEISDISDDIVSQKQDGKSKIGVSTADITALSDKYGRMKSNKSQLYDGFKNLEQKYLKKTSQKKLRTESPELSDRKSGHKSSKTVKESKPEASDDSLVDDELARYLNENSLEDNPKELDNHDGSVAESDELLNLNNIMTVDDILGQLTEGDGDDAESQCEDKDTKINHASPVPIDQTKRSNRPSVNSIAKSNVVPQRRKSIFEGESGSPFYSKKNVNTNESSLKSHEAENKDDSDNDKTEGLLFTQVTDNIFHSSRRNSLMSPVFRRKNSSKSLLSESVQDIQDDGSEVVDEGSVAESVEEDISVPHESSTAKSVAEASVSEKVPADFSEDFVSDDAKSPENKVTKSRNAVKAISKADIRAKATLDNEKHGKDILSENKAVDSKRKLSWGHGAPSTSYQKNDAKIREQVIEAQKSSDEDEEEKVDKKSRKKTAKHDIRSHKKARRKHKKKSRRRSPSVSSSTSSSSSTTSSSSSSESSYHLHERNSRKTKKKKSHSFNPWLSNPYMSPWWWMQIQQHSFSASAETPFYFPNSRLLEGLLPSSSIVGVQDIMRQQVALTRQFMDSQKAMYHAYTATLTSSYRYTSLRDTENYIKQRKHPLTFDEAYRLVKEEMKDAKK